MDKKKTNNRIEQGSVQLKTETNGHKKLKKKTFQTT